jgi:hypothetical protein
MEDFAVGQEASTFKIYFTFDLPVDILGTNRNQI